MDVTPGDEAKTHDEFPERHGDRASTLVHLPMRHGDIAETHGKKDLSLC